MSDRMAPRFIVTILPDATAPAGKVADALDGRVISVTIDDDERGADKLEIQLYNEDLFFFEQGDDVLPGAFLEVSWGYAGNMAPPRRFAVKKISGRHPLRIEALAISAQAHRESKHRFWAGKTRSEVVALVARDMGYEGDAAIIDATDEVLDINQMGETDAALLRRLADDEEFEFWIDDTGLHWHQRRTGDAPTHVLTWFSDRTGTIRDWSPETNLMRRVGRVDVAGRDPITKRDIKASATGDTVDRPTLGEVKEVVDPETGETKRERSTATATGGVAGVVSVPLIGAVTIKEASRKAAAAYRAAEREAVKLNISLVGDPTIRAKTVVDLRGISSMFSGRYYLASVRHVLDGNGYTVEAKANRDGVTKNGSTADRKIQTQGGQRNRQDAQEPGTVERRVEVDPETGRQTERFVRKGAPRTSDHEAT